MDKQTAVIPLEKAEKQEEKNYWARVGGTYRFAFRALLLLLPIFVIVFMALCAGGFTRNSVFGFGKDLRTISSFLSSDYATVTYTYAQGERTVLSYRNGVAAVTSDGIEIYSPDGERLLNMESPFSSPRAVCSQKYLLAYDFAARSFVVTGAYGVLFSGQTDFPIYGAAMADTGHFALITGSDTHLSQVLLYDANFKLIQRFARDSATTAVAVSDNGKYVVIGGVTSDNEGVSGLVELYRIGVQNSTFRKALNEAVIAVDFTDNRHLAVLGASALRMVDLNGEVECELAFDGAALCAFDVNENGCALSVCTDPLRRESRVILLDEKGELLYDDVQAEDVTDIALTRETVFFLCEAKVVRLSLKSGVCDEVVCTAGAQGILAANGDAVRIIYAGEARLVEFD